MTLSGRPAGAARGDPKVTLSGLLFALNWEDPDLDRAAFAIDRRSRIATVCSGSCNTFAFLLDDPQSILAFDSNPAQVWLLELKAAAYGHLDHAAMLELLGVRPSGRRAHENSAHAPNTSAG